MHIRRRHQHKGYALSGAHLVGAGGAFTGRRVSWWALGKRSSSPRRGFPGGGVVDGWGRVAGGDSLSLPLLSRTKGPRKKRPTKYLPEAGGVDVGKGTMRR